MSNKINLPFHTISKALQSFQFPDADLVIGIGRGGVVPACMVAHQLSIPLKVIKVNHRDDSNAPLRDSPVILGGFNWDMEVGTRILVVDDVSVTGKTLAVVKEKLKKYKVHTFVLKGKADMVLLPDVKTCVNWPWKPIEDVV